RRARYRARSTGASAACAVRDTRRARREDAATDGRCAPRRGRGAYSGRDARLARRTRRTRGSRAPGGSRLPGRTVLSARSFLEDLFGDDELHDLARAFVDLGDLRVAVVALGGKVLEISVAAVDLDAVTRRAHRRASTVRCEDPPRPLQAGSQRARGNLGRRAVRYPSRGSRAFSRASRR